MNGEQAWTEKEGSLQTARRGGGRWRHTEAHGEAGSQTGIEETKEKGGGGIEEGKNKGERGGGGVERKVFSHS